jgi:2-dehydro-3-deoxyphosphogluconate aldolase/(4S)-4-hydroxy-2-oxoglutarate aldolase
MKTLEELGFELRHIGINCESEGEADAVAQSFDDIFGFTKKVGNSSIFAGTAIEAMKTPYLGAKGHIAIGTTDMEAAVEYLTAKGVKFNQDSAKYKDDKLTAIYLEQEIGGFAVHLVKK